VDRSASLDAALGAASSYVRSRFPRRPLVGIVLGSGLGDLADQVRSPCVIPFGDIPNHPRATAAGHTGQLVLGSLEGVEVAVWRGRAHFYEGCSMAEVGFPIRLLDRLGGRAVILTNAAGALNESFMVGDLMLLTDHINLPGLVGHNPLRGEQPPGAQRFVDLIGAYDAELRRLALAAAERVGQLVQQGVYVMVAGPSYETAAEARLLRRLGADAVGMSTVPEVIVSRQLGLRVAALSAITNVLLGSASAGAASHAEVLAAAETLEPRFAALVRGMLAGMSEALTR
jgi:purine-nucleoside phosphorylase